VSELNNWAQWLENSNLAVYIRESLYFYPIIEIIHIIGFVFLVGTAVMFDFRLLGLSKNISVKSLSKHLLPWSRGSLFLIIPSGILLFITNAKSLSEDPVFLVKLSCIALAGANTLIFHQTIFKSASLWDQDCNAPKEAKFIAIASIFLWLTVISCGRLLAY
jgi:hypothetical protein